MSAITRPVKRRTVATVRDGGMERYQVGDETCGLVGTRESLNQAEELARNHQSRHPEAVVTVFDRLAHRGSVELYQLVTRQGVTWLRAVCRRENGD